MGRRFDAGSSGAHRQQLQQLHAMAVVVFCSMACVLMPGSVAAPVGQTVLVAGDMAWQVVSCGTFDIGVVGMSQHGRSRQQRCHSAYMKPWLGAVCSAKSWWLSVLFMQC